ncbi:MAG: lytic transglycosylase domain-containing protein [Clostridia bacterium]|nr:lytic transglycosylase domain-containing protein [Desulfitobacteriaceae bacterium]MDD4146683.1 lytic transglycosylase domain-containing protein [Clostridia bacterium]
MYKVLRKIIAILLLGFICVRLFTSSWFLQRFYPYPHRELIRENCDTYAVDTYLVLAIMKTESRFHSGACSRVGAAGLMQIMPETGKWIAAQMSLEGFEAGKLFEPRYNIPMGIWYIAYLYKSFDGNTVKVLAAYNAGATKVKSWLREGLWTGDLQDLAQIPYPETRKYVDRVLFNYQVYKYLYTRDL